MRHLSIVELRKLLGVSEDASPDQIARAYHKAVLQTHPDKGGNPELFNQVVLAHKILLSPRELAEYIALLKRETLSQCSKIDINLYRTQFMSYNEWFKHSLALVKTVRSYRRGFSFFMASDIAADAFLKALETKIANKAELMKFIEGDGRWDTESTKTVFFELLHGPIASTNPADKKAEAIRWLASLGDFAFSDNPNRSNDDRDFFVAEFKRLNARQLAIDIELGYLARHLTTEEYLHDPFVQQLLREQLMLKPALENICAHIHMRDTIVSTWAEQSGPLAAEQQLVELTVLQIAYEYSLLEIGLNQVEDVEEAKDALIMKRDAARLSQIMLQAEARTVTIEAAERQAVAKARAEAETRASEAAARAAVEEAIARVREAAVAAPIADPAISSSEHSAGPSPTTLVSSGEGASAIPAAMPFANFYREAQAKVSSATPPSLTTQRANNVVIVDDKAASGCGCFWGR